MPFYDGHKHIIDDLEGAEMQTISHLNNWWAPADQGKARLFKTLTQKFFTWDQSDTGEDILHWRDAAGFAAT